MLLGNIAVLVIFVRSAELWLPVSLWHASFQESTATLTRSRTGAVAAVSVMMLFVRLPIQLYILRIYLFADRSFASFFNVLSI